MALMDVRQEPGPYGQGAELEPEKALGRHDFELPVLQGQELVIRDETWRVTRVESDAVYVTPVGRG